MNHATEQYQIDNRGIMVTKDILCWND